MPDLTDTVEDPESQDEEYDENEDEDFNPEAAVGADEDVSASSEDEDEAAQRVKATKKRKAAAPTDADEELDSGDEATIKERKRKRRKGKDKDEDEDSGGEGGLIKTRAQRLVEKAERKQRKRLERGEVTVDVDALWAELSSLPLGRPSITVPKPKDNPGTHDDNKENQDTAPPTTPADQLIKIKRRIEFAGEVTEVEEEVLRSSSAAQRYLAEHPEADPDFKPDTSSNGLLRPVRRPSIFEPNPTAAVRGVPADKLRPRAPSRMDVLMAEKRAEDEKKKKAEKMSTVQKSALDWRGFVKDQGIGDELDEYGKSKRGFLAREQFLDRVAGANEEARRAARLKV